MHHHLEIVIPPTERFEAINAAVEEILAPFGMDTEHDDDDEDDDRYTFWDYWKIGGRWSGEKRMAGYDQTRLAEFRQWIESERITVSGVCFGKPELSPASQIAKVDAKWFEMFGVAEPCPIFKHSGDREPIAGDICPLSDAMQVKAGRVIFAIRDGDSWKAYHMLCDSLWNGTTWQDTTWDGSMREAVESVNRELSRCRDEWCAPRTPQPDWTTITVDYHS